MHPVRHVCVVWTPVVYIQLLVELYKRLNTHFCPQIKKHLMNGFEKNI